MCICTTATCTYMQNCDDRENNKLLNPEEFTNNRVTMTVSLAASELITWLDEDRYLSTMKALHFLISLLYLHPVYMYQFFPDTWGLSIDDSLLWKYIINKLQTPPGYSCHIKSILDHTFKLYTDQGRDCCPLVWYSDLQQGLIRKNHIIHQRDSSIVRSHNIQAKVFFNTCTKIIYGRDRPSSGKERENIIMLMSWSSFGWLISETFILASWF